MLSLSETLCAFASGLFKTKIKTRHTITDEIDRDRDLDADDMISIYNYSTVP